MFCKQCGAKVEVKEAAFCQECGTPIDTQKNENTLESLSKHIEYKNDERIKELKSRLSTGGLLAKADIGEKEKQNLNIERVKEGVSRDVSNTDVPRGLHVSVPPEEIVEVIVEKKEKGSRSVLFIVIGVITVIIGAIFYFSYSGETKQKKVPKSTQVHTQKESVNTKEKDEPKTSTKSNTNVKDDLYDQAQKEREKQKIMWSAEQVVVDYIEALDRNDYRKVYDLMSPRKREEVGPYHIWVKGFTEPDTRIQVNGTKAISIEGDKVLVRYEVAIQDDGYKPWKTKSGVARVMLVGGEATLDDINNQ
ncbi:zinc ribbon domain-containing protein [Veillonella sp. CHU740]|uniref:zinc ribbon domain-containing protein n=1 Tax=Veillonella sp. CHU740 TaxID=2490950 RepID=UPI000F8E67DA|nr:zinc ribbon domain-containing protein [Veillonella sp. CHU740]